jgi:hypothetical protein
MDQSSHNFDGGDTENVIDQQWREPIRACDLLEPDAVREAKDLPHHPPRSEPTPKVREAVFAYRVEPTAHGYLARDTSAQ